MRDEQMENCFTAFKMLQFFFVLAFCAFCSCQLPPYVKKCQKSAPMSQCLMENFETVLRNSQNGSKALFIPVLNPYTLSPLSMTLPFLKFDIYKGYLWGLDDTKMNDVNLNLDEGIFNLDFTFPKITALAAYGMDGELFGFNLNAQNHVQGFMSMVNVIVKMNVTRRDVIDGKTFLVFNRTEVKMVPRGAYLNFKDTIPGNPTLSELFNTVVNLNVMKFINLLEPIVSSVVTDIVLGTVNGVFSEYSIEDLFLD